MLFLSRTRTPTAGIRAQGTGQHPRRLSARRARPSAQLRRPAQHHAGWKPRQPAQALVRALVAIPHPQSSASVHPHPVASPRLMCSCVVEYVLQVNSVTALIVREPLRAYRQHVTFMTLPDHDRLVLASGALTEPAALQLSLVDGHEPGQPASQMCDAATIAGEDQQTDAAPVLTPPVRFLSMTHARWALCAMQSVPHSNGVSWQLQPIQCKRCTHASYIRSS